MSGHSDLTTNGYRRRVKGTMPLHDADVPSVHNEAEVIAAFNLPDTHCQDCHESGHMSCVLVGERLIDVCCYVTENYRTRDEK
jgi:ArsR family metal-binding transcriptional regulator